MNSATTYSSKIHPSAKRVTLLSVPMHPTEHLIHAVAALEAAARGEKPEENRAYAKRRVECIDAILSQYKTIKIAHRKAFDAELASVRAAIT